MLENLLEIELAYELLLEGDKGGESSVDSHYKTLNSAIDPVEAGSEEFAMLQKYLQNTHGETHSNYSLEVENVSSPIVLLVEWDTCWVVVALSCSFLHSYVLF
jgi:hypothetical protein